MLRSDDFDADLWPRTYKRAFNLFLSQWKPAWSEETRDLVIDAFLIEAIKAESDVSSNASLTRLFN